MPQAQDEALQLQKAEVALKDPENDAEPAMKPGGAGTTGSARFGHRPCHRARHHARPEEKSLISARDPNLQKDRVPPLLDTPWLTPDPLPDKEDPTPEVAEDQAEDPSTVIQTALAEAANTPPEASCAGADRSTRSAALAKLRISGRDRSTGKIPAQTAPRRSPSARPAPNPA